MSRSQPREHHAWCEQEQKGQRETLTSRAGKKPKMEQT